MPPASPRRPALHRAGGIALTVGALLGTLCLALAVAGAAFGITPLVVLSGSMSPAVETGALAVSRSVPAADVRVGDVVSVRNAAGVRITHRVVSVGSEEDRASLTLKGDANGAADPEPYVVTSADRVLFDVPGLGYVVAWTATPAGVFTGALLASLILLIGFAPTRSRGRRAAPRRRAPQGTSRHLVVGSVLACAGVAGAHHAPLPETTLASWSASAAMAATYSTHTVLPPNSVNCSGGGLDPRLTYTWPSKGAQYGYQVEVWNSAAALHGTPRRIAGTTATSYSTSFEASDLPSGSFTVRVRSFLTSSEAWLSATSTNSPGSKESVLILPSISC